MFIGLPAAARKFFYRKYLRNFKKFTELSNFLDLAIFGIA